MTIHFLRVMSIRSHAPGVVAIAAGHRVRWNPRPGWDCDCLTDDDDLECNHIEAVRALLDERVLTAREDTA